MMKEHENKIIPLSSGVNNFLGEMMPGKRHGRASLAITNSKLKREDTASVDIIYKNILHNGTNIYIFKERYGFVWRSLRLFVYNVKHVW